MLPPNIFTSSLQTKGIRVRGYGARHHVRAFLRSFIQVRHVLVAVFISFSIGSYALATELPKHPKLITTDKEAVRWSFSDGREMVLMVDPLPPALFPIDLSFSSTTCARKVTSLPKCSALVPAALFRIALHWSKNPDSTRVGKVVHREVDGESTQELSEFNQLVAYHRYSEPEKYSQLPAYQISCDDYSWLLGTKSAASEKKILSWSSETMLENPETGQTENTTISTIYNLEFTPSSDGRLTLKSTGVWQGTEMFFMRMGLMFGDVFHLVELSEKNEICQTSLKPNASSLEATLIDYMSKYPIDYRPYIYNSDSLLEHLQNSYAFVIRQAEYNTEEQFK